MARTEAAFPGGPRFSDFLGLGVIAQAFPQHAVEAALEACGVGSMRRRDLPLEAMVYYVIAMGLFRRISAREVLRCLADGLRLVAPGIGVQISGRSSISRARSRLGTAPFEELRRSCVIPLAEPDVTGSQHTGLRVLALDGAMLDLPDEERNRETFGIPSTVPGEAAIPKARLTLLLETGTRVALAWRADPAIGKFEHPQAEALLAHLEPRTLVLADRGYFDFSLWSMASETGADLLWRMPTNAHLHPAGESFEDGSWPAELRRSESDRRRSRDACRTRVVEYRLAKRPGETVRLATTLRDPDRFPAHELASLYHERWEIENAHDEVKTHLLEPGVALRSKTPELVIQEINGLMLAHYAVRSLIHRATGTAQRDPVKISSTHAVRVVRRRL